jgi:pimeloyl-ACP methyl ester carboxylesterase
MDREIEIAGKKIFYHVYGNGKPVMLVHGFGETGTVWKNQIDFLQDKFHLIVPDLPGSGQSEMIDDMSMEGMPRPPQTPPKEGLPKTQSQPVEDSLLKDEFMFIVPDLPGSGKSEMIDDMSMEGMAEVIKTILDAESSKIPPLGGGAALIGHSMGGYITLAFAEKYHEHLSAFGLFHSTAYPDNEDKKAIRRKGIEFIKEHGAFEFLKTSILNLFSPDTKQRSPRLIDQFVQSLNNFSPEALVSYYHAMMQRPDRTDVLKNTKVPVLFTLGKYDNAVSLEDGLKLCHLPEKSYIHILHQSGHMGMLEEADKSSRILEKFLSEN